MQTLPFSALVGLDLARHALLLLAIDPELRGVVLAAATGTGKSSLARGFKVLLDPDTPFVELPSGVDAENLLGGLDLATTLLMGEVRLHEGLLAKADEGIIYVDDLNLLADSTANLLLSVMDANEVVVERDGISRRLPAHFRLVGAYDPAGGVPRQHLMDRVGLIVPLVTTQSEIQRRDIIEHNLYTDPDHWAGDDAFVRGLVVTGRRALPHVTISDEQIQQLAQIASACGVQGHRVDMFAVRAACASAAASLRETVHHDDLAVAARLVIFPRATKLPQANQTETSILSNISLEANLNDLPFYTAQSGRIGSKTNLSRRGRHIGSAQGHPRRDRIDVVATLRAAAAWQPLRSLVADDPKKRVQLTPADLRVKNYRSKARTLFCFVVVGDIASRRLAQVKEAVHTLLEKAYLKQDQVALIASNGEHAELLLPPTQSIELTQRTLNVLPIGAGTALASAIMVAGDLARQATLCGMSQTVLILLTDGYDPNPSDTGQRLGKYRHSLGLPVMVIDTNTGTSEQLAAWLGADYAHLPDTSGEKIGKFIIARY